MKNRTINIWLFEIISALFILLFVYTGISKLFDFHKFRVVLTTSPLIGSKATVIAWTIPTIELITALLLLIPRLRISGLYLSLVLMVAFTSYVGYMTMFSSSLPCSCGGVIQQMTWSQHLAFNILFTILSLTSIWIYKKQTNQEYMAEVQPKIFT